MHPILIKPFGFAIYTYSAVLLLAFILGTGLAIWIAKQRGPTDPEYIQEVTLYGILWGLLGGRLGWILWDIETYWADPAQVFNLRAGGLTILGGIVLPIVMLFVSFRRKGYEARSVLDIYAAPLLLGMAIGRIGCLLGGCCQGQVCSPDFPLGITYPAGTFGSLPAGPRYPSPLFEAFADLLLMGVIIWFMPRIKFAGQAIYLMLTGYGVIRFLNELTRGDIKFIGPITIAQWVAVGMFVFGLLGFLGFFGKPEPDYSWQKGPDKATES